jgi:aspartate/methionine/tyrosine aminotransferase
VKTARRLERIEPFYVMECAKAAREIAATASRPMLYLNIGEPDFTAAPLVVEAAARALRDGATQYTQAFGTPELREAIARWYGTHFGIDVAPERIAVTAGASAALQLITLALLDEGDEVLLPDPSYPCNRHFVAAAGGRAVLLPTTAAQRFQLDAAAVDAAWGAKTRGVLLASPSNPTGTSIARDEMRRIADAVRARGGFTIVDEIYLGLSYDKAFGHSALEHGDDVIVLSSFSKYFGMTGWRLGWLVLPESLVPAVEKLAQNLYICASSIAQAAALACFEPTSLAEYERRRAAFKARRDFIVPALERLGLPVPVVPDGAFYAWFDCSAKSASSWDFVFETMRRAQVALTPGRDFGVAAPERFVRLSFASDQDTLREAVERLATVW